VEDALGRYGPLSPEQGLHLTRGGLLEQGTVDLIVEGDSIARVGPAIDLDSSGTRELILEGFLILPALAEPHVHLDTAFVGDVLRTKPGDLENGIDAWLRYQVDLPKSDFVDRAKRALLLLVANGATAVRSHVGIYEPIGLRAVEALLEVRDWCKGLVELQLVALSLRMTGNEARDLRAWMRDAMDMGMDIVGGVPALDPDPAACMELILDLAAEYSVPVDLHIDEATDPNIFWLPRFLELIKSTGFPNAVTASHCVSLGMQREDVARDVAVTIADSKVGVVCNPLTNLYLQARDIASATPRGLTALRALREAGVTLGAGSDNVRDPLNAVGRADPLETASLLVTAGHASVEEALEMVSSGARAIMGLPEVRLEPGYPAEILAIRASTLAEVISGETTDRIVLHRGRVVAETNVHREYPLMVR
jgi:cytosine deaminase